MRRIDGTFTNAEVVLIYYSERRMDFDRKLAILLGMWHDMNAYNLGYESIPYIIDPR